MEDSPRGLWRTLGKRVGFTPSRVRISHPPLFYAQTCGENIENKFQLPSSRNSGEAIKTSVHYSREYQSSGIVFECSCNEKCELTMKLTMKDKSFGALTDIDSMADGMKLFPEWLRLQAYVAGSIAASSVKVQAPEEKKKKRKKKRKK